MLAKVIHIIWLIPQIVLILKFTHSTYNTIKINFNSAILNYYSFIELVSFMLFALLPLITSILYFLSYKIFVKKKWIKNKIAKVIIGILMFIIFGYLYGILLMVLFFYIRV